MATKKRPKLQRLGHNLSAERKVETLQIVAGIFRQAADDIDAALLATRTKIHFRGKASKKARVSK